MGGLLFLPALCGEVFWSAGILAALGKYFAVAIIVAVVVNVEFVAVDSSLLQRVLFRVKSP